MRIVGFVGKRMSGKTEATNLFIQQAQVCGYTYRKLSFVDTIVELFAASKQMSAEEILYTYSEDQYLQDLWEFVHDHTAKDRYFLPMALIHSLAPGERAVIDDVSSIEELEVLWRHGAKIFKIETSPEKRSQRGWRYTKGIDDTAMETELADMSPHVFVPYGGFIYNNGTQWDLEKEIGNIVGKYLFQEAIKVD